MRAGVEIRAETAADVTAADDVQRRAFGPEGDAIVRLVHDLRSSLAGEGGLSLVAVADGVVVGHVMFTRNLLDAPARLVDVQVLSPLAVSPERQRTGVGGALIETGIAELEARAVPLVFLEGSPAYYPRFGFRPGGELGFRKPSLRIPDAAFQVRPLASYEPSMTGTLVYRREFWDHDAVGLR